MTGRISYFLVSLINTIVYIIIFFLGFRIILRLFSANPATPMVAWIYHISSALITPFRGLFPDLATQTGVLDVVAATTLLGYTIFGYLLTLFLKDLPENERDEIQTATTHYHDIDRQNRPHSK